jgi:hypothetical protein
MKLLTTTGTFREQFQARYPVYRHTISRLITSAADFADANGWAFFAVISLWCGWMRLSGDLHRRLGHDELYTFYISQAASLTKLLALTRTVDLHPPLSYLLVRLSFAVFGVSAWSCRLPFAAAFILTSVFIFWLSERMLSPLYGLIAVLFLWSCPYSNSASMARPYSLLLCFTSMMLVCWYCATESVGHRVWALVGLSVGGFGLLLSHVLGVLPFAAVVGAELLRFRIARKTDWHLWLAFLAPLISLLTYLPLLKTHSALLFTPVYRVTPIRLLSCYWEPLRFAITPLLLITILAAARLITRSGGDSNSGRGALAGNLPLGFLLLSLFLTPLLTAIVFAWTGTAFFERYGVVMLLPVAIVPAMLLAFGTRCRGPYAVGMVLLLAALIHINSSGMAWLLEQASSVAPPAVAARLLYLAAMPPVKDAPKVIFPAYLEREWERAPEVSDLNSAEPGLALVAGTGLTFLELDHSENANLAQRLFLLTNKEAAVAITHDTLFENYEQLQAVFPLRGTVEPYCSFLRSHRRFLVLGAYNHPQGWLLRKLDADGARLRIIGKYASTLEEHDLYEVIVPLNLCQSLNSEIGRTSSATGGHGKG